MENVSTSFYDFDNQLKISFNFRNCTNKYGYAIDNRINSPNPNN